MKRVTWAIIGLCVVAGILAACAPLWLPAPSPEIPEMRRIYPVGTATPGGNRAGLNVVRDFSAPLATPIPGQVGSHYQIYWSDVQPNVGDTPNWSAVSTRVAAIAAEGMGAWLSLAFYEASACGVANWLGVPTGVPTVTFAEGSCGTNYGPNYGSAILQNAYDVAVTSLLTTFGNDPNVAGFILEAGVDGEASNTKEKAAGAMAAFELQVTCAKYVAWVQRAMRTWRAGTTKPIYLNTGTQVCAGRSSWGSSAELMRYSYRDTPVVPPGPYDAPTPTPLWIGYKNNGASGERGDRWAYGLQSPWGSVQAGARQSGIGGSAFEPGLFPASYPTAEQPALANQMVWGLLGPGKADNLFLQAEWLPLLSADTRFAITMTAGTDATNSPAAWVAFYDARYARTGSTNYAASGLPGPYTHLLTVLSSAQPTRVCEPAPYATAQAQTWSWSTPAPCTVSVAPTGGDPAGAMGYRYAAGTQIGLDLDDTWISGYAAGNDFTLQVTYLASSGSFTVSWLSTVATSTVNSLVTPGGGTGLETATLAVNDLVATDSLLVSGSTRADLRITAGTGGVTLYRVWLQAGTAVTPTLATATASPTIWPGATATWTVTPSPTGTRPSVTKTPDATATRWAGYYLDSPMDTAPAENWDGYSTSGAAAIVTATAECVTAGCWQWNGVAGFAYAQVYDKYIPFPYSFNYTTTNGSLHMAFDIKMVETPVTGINVLNNLSGLNTGLSGGLSYFPRASGTPYPWVWYTQGTGAFWWDAPDGVWQRIDVYADQQGPGYKNGTMTPEPGEIPFRVSVNGTPIATPTGKPPSLEIISALLPLDGWRIDYYNNIASTYKYRLDNFLLQHMVCDTGTCPSPTPETPVVWTATPSPTPTPSVTPTPTPTGNAPEAHNAGSACPAESTTLYKDNPFTAWNDAEREMPATTGLNASSVMLLQWPCLAKPAWARGVLTATLSLSPLSMFSEPVIGPVWLLYLAEMATPWTAGGATWAFSGLGPWNNLGAQGATDVRSIPAQVYDLRTIAEWTDMQIDVTTNVRGWLDEGRTNNGWRVRLQQALCPGGFCVGAVTVGSDRYFNLDQRPRLDIVWAVDATPTPTATPTASPTPIAVCATATTTPATPTPTPTVNATPSATPAPGLRINEICPVPGTDYNLDGYVNANDRAIELINVGSAPIDLYHYRLEIYDSQTAQTYTYIYPREAKIWNNQYKVVYSEDLKDYVGNDFVVPDACGSYFNRVTLYDPTGVQLDRVEYQAAGADACFARYPNGGPTWDYRSPTLGKVNR